MTCLSMFRTRAGRTARTMLFVFLLLAVAAPVTWADDQPAPRPKYVFLMIGDGMGAAQRFAAELFKAAVSDREVTDPKVKLTMNKLPVQGMMTTHAKDSAITDSAAAGTAMASGLKTASGVVGKDASGIAPYPTLAEKAKARGMKVAILTTVSIDHATPACFYAHQKSRREYYEIGRQLVDSPFDFFAGGAFKKPRGGDGTRENLLDLCAEKGFKVVTDLDGFEALKPEAGRAVALFPDNVDRGSMDYEIDRLDGSQPSLADMTRKAVEMVSGDRGFFMMVEGGKIDWSCHAHDAVTTIRDTLAFDEAVRAAYEFYRRHPKETLIVVTADHETGGMTIGYALSKYSTHFDRLAGQTMSSVAFTKRFNALKKKHDDRLTLEKTAPLLREAFGLLLLEPGEIEALAARAKDGDAKAARRRGMALTPYEIAKLQAALAMSLQGKKVRPRNEDTYLNYGYYEPFTVAALRVLGAKAGVGWTTFSHTATPVPVSAIGVGAETFGGYYDNTELSKKLETVMGIGE